MVDPTVAAVPAYAATIVAERAWLRRRAATQGPSAADYDTADMTTSLAMGVLSLVAPLVAPRVMRPLVPGVGRAGGAMVVSTVALAAVAAVADRLARPQRLSATSVASQGVWMAPRSRRDVGEPVSVDLTVVNGLGPTGERNQLLGSGPNEAGEPEQRLVRRLSPAAKWLKTRKTRKTQQTHQTHQVRRPRWGRNHMGVALPGVAPKCASWRQCVATFAAPVASLAGTAAVVAGGATAAASWAWLTDPSRLWRHRVVGDLGDGPVPFAAAMVGWDFIYYWNHRFMHECRAMWAIHVVHHSSERYNLSTALRQPVADALGVFVPYGLLSLCGIRPSLVASARAWNLLYQYWIHTDVIRSLGPAEKVLNSPSAHRVHHGSNRRYLDRNHGGILIVWDRLFGTHQTERPDEPVVYGLTANIETFNPLRVASHEHRAMLGDVSRATSWSGRLGYMVRHPGWQPAG